MKSEPFPFPGRMILGRAMVQSALLMLLLLMIVASLQVLSGISVLTLKYKSLGAALGLWLFLTWTYYDATQLSYARARRLIQQQRSLMAGIFSNEIKRQELTFKEKCFLWAYGLRAMRVALGNDQWMKAYLPEGQPFPAAAEPLRLYSWGSYRGEMRYVAEVVILKQSVARG